jgi:hypothetical protein
MRADLGRLLRNATLTTLALAIGIGISLYQIAAGIANLLTTLFTNFAPPFAGEPRPQFLSTIRLQTEASGGGLTWVVGRRILTVGRLVDGVIELVLVLAVAAVLRKLFAEERPTETA